MKKIKEFATLCGTSSKTLRFYDKIGLLEAEYTDPETGYRYYNDRQKDKYTVITLFKEIGFTLDEIKNEILVSDQKHILEMLRKKEAELRKALDLCMQQIEGHEESLRRQEAAVGREVTVRRYDEENKIVVSDGVLTRIFACTGESMDACAEAMCELFCAPAYVNISLDDVEATDEDRTVLVQSLEGTKEEVLSLDFSTLFKESDKLEEIRTVIMTMKLSPDAGLDEVNTIAAKLHPFFPDCVIIWGVSFDTDREDYAKVCIVGVY